MFEHYRSRIEAIGRRPYLRAGIQALTSKWEQNNEPPPAPPQIEQETVTPWKREAAEEDYFNASDDEETAAAAATTPRQEGRKTEFFRKFSQGGRAAKRIKTKKVPRNGPLPTTDSATKSQSPGVATGSTAAEGLNKPAGAALGLDYDDGSDSDSSNGTQSPRSVAGAVPTSPSSDSGKGTAVTEELEEDLADVTMRMRAKRQREEEEDADFAGLFGTLSKGGNARKPLEQAGQDAPKLESSSETPAVTPVPVDQDKEKEREGAAPDALTPGKRLKLNLGFGRKSK